MAQEALPRWWFSRQMRLSRAGSLPNNAKGQAWAPIITHLFQSSASFSRFFVCEQRPPRPPLKGRVAVLPKAE